MVCTCSLKFSDVYISCCWIAAMESIVDLAYKGFSNCFSLQLITDVNIAVAVEAIQAIGNLASGLRLHFSGSSRFLLPVLLVSTIMLFLQGE
jgi:hypothetical protein